MCALQWITLTVKVKQLEKEYIQLPQKWFVKTKRMITTERTLIYDYDLSEQHTLYCSCSWYNVYCTCVIPSDNVIPSIWIYIISMQARNMGWISVFFQQTRGENVILHKLQFSLTFSIIQISPACIVCMCSYTKHKKQ